MNWIKQIYLKEQKQIAAVFLKKGGEIAKLGQIRIEEANRVAQLSDKDFLDYVGPEYEAKHLQNQ